MGAAGVRLRWPNDLLIGKKKLAGLLIEQPATGKLIVGFGLNIHNAPWEQMPELTGVTTRLGDWMTPPPLEEIAAAVLHAIASAHASMEEHGMAPAIEALNRHWLEPLAVELLLTDGRRLSGVFTGLDAVGNLRLLDEEEREFVVEHQLVERLKELF
jgi:BirA family biotin operon repressor/biotin-[acetyl-CoA-carboxylase] ligase